MMYEMHTNFITHHFNDLILETLVELLSWMRDLCNVLCELKYFFF